jgi:hypothetical protein
MEYFVRVDAIGANGYGVSTKSSNTRIIGGNCRQFCRSNKGEIARIKE